jgi:hypothetical protein
MFKARVWVCGVVIALIYWSTWLGANDNSLSKSTKHLFGFSLLVLVGALGYYAWSSQPQEWAKKLWLFLYLSVILILLIFGTIDFFKMLKDESLKNMLASLRLFFTSPVPFGILMYLVRRFQS